MSQDIIQNQIISIVGATASGKTDRALTIARENIEHGVFKKVHLLSADSRQVYQGLEILTGADIPAAWKRTRDDRFPLDFFLSPDATMTLHGVSIIEANQEWSVAHFAKLYQHLRQQLDEQEQLIVVGGSGSYQKQLQGEFDSLGIPPNPSLRETLNPLSVDELQERLRTLNPTRLEQMNHSDVHNPRRLIRAIEIAHAQQADPTLLNDRVDAAQVPIIYLQSDEAVRERAIRERVAMRFPLAVREIQALLSKYQLDLKELPNWQSLSSTGVSELVAYLRAGIDQSTCLENWAKQEIRYAKTQQLYTDKHVLY